jgi:hypothetical protein
MRSQKMSQKRPILNYVVAYLLWIVSTGLGILTLYRAREALLLGMVVASNAGNPSDREIFYSNLRAQAVQSWTVLLVGILLLIVLVGVENFYRMSVPSGKLMRRFLLVSGIEFGVLFIAHASYYAILQTFRPFTWIAIAFPVVEILMAVLFFWLYRRQSRKSMLAPQ